ncbi:hypothetical protein QBC47DRAFT_307679 [Echria macrotheca]|uniref:NAD-dependent epimerase/dehydratase domain-containing protein n=1 Tax=Echria macrotheca TaxID=438768 RepID=A0AAJ0B6S7_9PEZI|nr:hypothetical protein QBC47DRAFT_307679 [Echria macrotheca]
MTTDIPKVLLTGPTGYIGGTVLSTLLASPDLKIHRPIGCLLRSKAAAETLTATYGPEQVNPILYEGLDDTEAATAAAASHDIVICCTLGYHTPSLLALLHGLAQRKAVTNKDVWMIQTSGTSNVGDLPVSGKYVHSPPDREFDDVHDDVYTFEKERDAVMPYPQRTGELAFIDAGIELGVKTVVMMSPIIYGIGTGLSNKMSIAVPQLAQMAMVTGKVVVIGDGKAVWDYVHVEDVAALYQKVLETIVGKGGEGLPTGKKGILFGGNGRHSWMELAEGVAQALLQAGKLGDAIVESVSLADATRAVAQSRGTADEDTVEVVFASNARTVASVGRKLGWVPKRGEESWRQGFHDDVKMVLQKMDKST